MILFACGPPGAFGEEVARAGPGSSAHDPGADELKTRRAPECGRFITCVEIASDGGVWVGDEDAGISHWDGTRWHRELRQAGIRNAYALAVTIPGTLWVGTLRDGVLEISADRKRQYSYSHGFPGRRAFSLHVDSEQRVWCGHERGLSVHSRSGWRNWSIREGIPGVPVTTVLTGQEGEVWIGTASDGVAGWDGERWQRFNGRNGLRDLRINCLALDMEGRLWAGTVNGLGMLPRDGGRWEWFENLVPSGEAKGGTATPPGLIWENRQPLFPSDDYVTCLLPNPDGSILAGTRMGGIRRLLVEKGEQARAEGLLKIPESYISCMARDGSGRLWIGTYGAGLFEVFPGIECFEDREICLVSDGRFTAASPGTAREPREPGDRKASPQPLWWFDHNALIRTLDDLGTTYGLGRVQGSPDSSILALHFLSRSAGPDGPGKTGLVRVALLRKADGSIVKNAGEPPAMNLPRSRVPEWLKVRESFEARRDQAARQTCELRPRRFSRVTSGTCIQAPEETIRFREQRKVSLRSQPLKPGRVYLLTFTVSEALDAAREPGSQVGPELELFLQQGKHCAGAFVVDEIPEEEIRIPYRSVSSSPVSVSFVSRGDGPALPVANVSLRPLEDVLACRGPFGEPGAKGLDETVELTAPDGTGERGTTVGVDARESATLSGKLAAPSGASQRSQQAFMHGLMNGRLDAPFPSSPAPGGRYLADLRISPALNVSYVLLGGVKGRLSRQCGNVALATWDEEGRDLRLLAWERNAPNFCHLLSFPPRTLSRMRLALDDDEFSISEIWVGNRPEETDD